MPTATQNSVIQVGELIASSDRVTPQTIVSEVSDRLFSSPNLEALAVVDGVMPRGLITRTKLFFTLSRRYGNELFAREPIITIADTSPLIVSDNELLDEVIEKAFARSPQNIYDEIIVAKADGTYVGLLSVKRLVLEQSNALSRSILQEEMATTRAKELERINQVKAQFLANVTHELRSPVNAIIGLAELLRLAADKGSMEQVQERLSFMISTATNLRAVITNILDLSKIEAGRMEVAHQTVEVGSLLHEIAETTRVLIGEKPVTVRVLAPAEPVIVCTDAIKLRQIVTNLTSNAAKFTERGSIEMCLDILEERVVIQIRDTGIGIREEDLQLIFSAFGQVEDATTKTHEGTGLGLTISKNIAKLLGGCISVTSSYGNGSTFSLSMPWEHNENKGVHSHAA
ncbi:sensor histidine kinase [Geobacter argillaceus]|uniref:histidine kinase n=1 Tax=Geobacter argillaceus TaxID=345631 RepID=A0A562VG60_9BACT|nr:ATP-binding protein [Geobacter argillaceus]TWJ16870.1 phospho-acceptor domain-containing protein [Geobacter argillaceus]